MRTSSSCKAFTLVELLVTIAIMCLLVGLLAPALKGIRETGKVMQCMNNLRQIGAAVQTYMADYEGKFPTIGGQNLTGYSANANWDTRLTATYLSRVKATSVLSNASQDGSVIGYYRESKVWWCPTAKMLNGTSRHYALNGFALSVGGPWRIDLYSMRYVSNPARTILIAELNNNITGMSPIAPPSSAGDVITNHRISHKGGKGANYLFVDGHVEYISGIQGWGASPMFQNCSTYQQKMWRWW
jgi:prepilin-type processing-associated H-X9-DG protein/prepilin-type N-terminal cleavage/methylation domain-containing protein